MKWIRYFKDHQSIYLHFDEEDTCDEFAEGIDEMLDEYEPDISIKKSYEE